MKLRTKISFIILAIWVVTAVLFYFGSHRIIMESYLRVEDKMVQSNLDRTTYALDQITEKVNAVVTDWSIWDDTYQFIEDKNQKFINANMVLSTFQATGLDMILFFNKQGKLVYAMGVNADRDKTVKVAPQVITTISENKKIIQQETPESGIKGLVQTPDGILLLAAHAITNSDGTLPPKGTMIAAKYFNKEVAAEIQKIVKIDTSFYPLKTINNDRKLHVAFKRALIKPDITTDKGTDTLTGYTIVNGINAEPIALLQIQMPRSLFKIGQETIAYSNILVLGYSLAITLLLWFLLQHLIVKRIEGLNKNIKKIGTDRHYFAKLIENVSDEVSSVAELYRQATHDPLTGLANKHLLVSVFHHCAEQLSAIDRKIVIVFVDVDNFKRINDTLGHEVGDDVLVDIAKRINGILRKNDIAARTGGDEFVVMLTDVSENEVIMITDRLFKAISKPIHTQGHTVYTTVSMGVSTYPDDSDSIEELIKQADMSMYHAKELGRNRYEKYTSTLNQAISESHFKERELQKALDEDQLRVYYQPIFDLKTKQIVSFEALLRWQHPERGLLGADEIVPLAEKTDLIKPIGQWVLKNACYQIKEWLDKGLPALPVAVNLSSEEIRSDAICDRVTTALKHANLESKYLYIEITETGFIELNTKLLSELRGLRANGVSLAIDDFGTGYSGLGYLKRLPVEKLKIDKTFIRDIHTDPDDKAIVLAIIAIAHQLNLRVTAEGVETMEQYNFLCYHQVDEVQGNYLSVPLSKEECEKLLTGEAELPQQK